MMRRLALLLLFSCTVAIPCFAQSDPNLKRGIAPGNTYRIFDIDRINEFNGNLMLRVPLSELPVGPSLKQALLLSYNSKIYEYEFVKYGDVLARRAIPETYSNAGFGWTMSLGTLVPGKAGSSLNPGRGMYYRAPDGSEHDFTTVASADPAEAVTTDGTFLRLKRVPYDTSLPLVAHELEMGDGTIHRFDATGALKQIRDRVGHSIEISTSDPMKWVITTTYNGTSFRTTTVNFENRTYPGTQYTYGPNFQKVVHSIVVPAFGGQTATYEFVYEDRLFVRGGNGDYIAGDAHEIAAPALVGVHLPEGLEYSFTYDAEGLVNSAKLPTGGSIEWQQQAYKLSMKNCDDEKGWVAEYPGVYKRILKDAGGIEIGEWTYETSIDAVDWGSGVPVACGALDGHNQPFGPPPTEVTTTVTASEMKNNVLTPIGGKTIHYFSARLNTWDPAYRPEEYGLPFTRKQPAHSSNSNRHLSTRLRDASDTLVRSTYLTYEGETTGIGEGLSNARVQGTLTVYDSDIGCGGVACRVDTNRTDYDGYGRYRTSVTTPNFGPTRTVFTNYLPNTTDWIFGTYDSSSVTENSVTRKELFTFDSNGWMTTGRTLIGSTPSSALDAKKDLLHAFCRDSRGFLESERFFGGDGPDASVPDSPCQTTPSATEYQIDHDFTFTADGAPATHTATYVGTTFYIANEDLDKNTGMVSISRDISGVATSFDYDKLGRAKTVTPTGGPWTSYAYATPSATIVPAVAVTTRAEGSPATADALTEAHVYYDWMGRAIQTKGLVPSDNGDKWATTRTVYDLFGRPTSQSVPELRDVSTFESTFTPAKSTTTTYDVLGRPLSMTGADGKTTNISYTGTGGTGVRKIATTQQVALATGSATVTTGETYDAYGRLTDVMEPTATTTHYSYDSAGHLTKVCQNTSDSGVTCGQARVFAYDNRGFLQSETHPENNQVNYTYDAAGHSLTKTIEGDSLSEANLQFEYDSAGRLLKAKTYSAALGAYRPGKVFAFASESIGTNKKLGKLESASRYNYNAGELVVKETYDYSDTAGRLKKTTTEIKKDGDVLQTFQQSQTYGVAGNVATLTYPTCFTVSCGSAAWNTASFTFGNGFLKSVSGFANSITYNASGAVSKVDHDGIVTDTYTPDETGVRPKSIQFEGQSTCTGPTITTGSPADQAIAPGTSTMLTVSAMGATAFQWFEGNGTKIVGQTGATYTTPSLTGVKTYYVEAYNDCKTVASRLVTVSACTSPPITTGFPADASIAPEQTAMLTVTANGATSFQWYEGNGTLIPGATSSSYTTPSLTATKTYYAKASNGCAPTTSRIATVTVRALPAPTGLVATAVGTSSVSIAWNASADAHHYVLDRKSDGTAFVQHLSNVTGTSVTDAAVVANKTYVYRVRAVSLTGAVSSPPSNADLATTMVFSALTPDVTDLQASHLEELRSAVNAVRAASGTPAATWSSILPAGTPAPAVDGNALAQHILSLRTAMNNARTALGFPGLNYTDSTLTDFDIRLVHQTEIRGGVQ